MTLSTGSENSYSTLLRCQHKIVNVELHISDQLEEAADFKISFVRGANLSTRTMASNAKSRAVSFSN